MEPMGRTMTNDLYVETVEHADWDDLYLTWVAPGPIAGPADLREPFERVAVALSERGGHILQEKIYGLHSEEESILQARREAFEARSVQPEVAPTFIEGAPCVGGPLAGLQLVAAAPKSDRASVDTVRSAGRAVGRELTAASHRIIFFSGVSGFESRRERCVGAQAGWMFRNARALLESQGMRPEHVLRTWIYLPRILDWYGEFNRVRTGCFTDFGILDEEGRGVLPASTGIQGRRTEGEECFMDVLAVAREDGSCAQATPIRNARQNEACDYGSSFSRGMTLALDERPTLYVSGTASINGEGATVYHGDSQGQVTETLLDVASLLESRGAELRDIRHATAYCKRGVDYETFRRVVGLLGLEDVPFVPVRADVCRDELLFEIDAIAVPQQPSAGGRR